MRAGVAEAVDRVGIRLFGVLRPTTAISGHPARVSTDELNKILSSCARVASSHAFSDIGQRCWPATHLLLDLLAAPAPAPAPTASACADPPDTHVADPVGQSRDPPPDLARLLGGKDVVELGSGTGAAAMLLATLPTDRRPRSLVCTELHRVASGVLARNAALNRVRCMKKTGALTHLCSGTSSTVAPTGEAVVASTSPTEGDNEYCERDRIETSASTAASGGSGRDDDDDAATAAGLVDLVPIEKCFADSAPADEMPRADSPPPTKCSPMRVSVAPLDWADIASGAL